MNATVPHLEAPQLNVLNEWGSDNHQTLTSSDTVEQTKNCTSLPVMIANLVALLPNDILTHAEDAAIQNKPSTNTVLNTAPLKTRQWI